MKFKDLRIGTRLAGAFGLLVVLLLAIAGVAVLNMGAMRAATVEITTNWLPSVEVVNQMHTATSDFRVLEMQHVLNTEDSAMAAIEAEMAKATVEFEKKREAYLKLISSDDERKLYDAFAADWKGYTQIHEKVLALSRKNENDKARELMNGDSKRLFAASSDALDKLVALNHDGAIESSVQSDKAFASARATVAVVSLIAIAMAVAAALALIRSITGPLNLAVAAADRVAGGDLSQAIEAGSRDETGLMLGALGRMQLRLAGTVSTVRQNSESVATASSQIAQGNNQLSQRTEEQASALEQTAASMEQITASVRQNADNASQANQLAMGATAVAVKGGEVVDQVVHTMKGINDSSRRIADIINVIDSIAFQTNILALNAAVEAARAGEQGRGFAVVASEVRTLASRSADAAKEIKDLINTSVERVAHGTVLVDQAGTTMAEVVASIRRVADIMGEINAASGEQSNGVSQVGEAIVQMDQVTQQNAALVEESAAAAESLREQAQQLVHAVATFKLQHGDAARTAASVAAPAAARGRLDGVAERAPSGAKQAAGPSIKPARRTTPTPKSAEPAVAPALATGSDDWAEF